MSKVLIYQFLLTIVCGFLIGMEREYSGKSIGIRTVSLLTLGSTLFAILSTRIAGADHARIIAQIVSGVGFLGAGVIFKDGATVKGLTTATTIFVAAAVGCLIGVEYFKEAFIATLIIIFINLVFTKFKMIHYERRERTSDFRTRKTNTRTLKKYIETKYQRAFC